MSSNLSIAVVEDHDFLRVSTVNLLRERGYRAEGYFCAEDLVEDNIIIQPDLYIIDLNLPGEDGLSLAKRIRAARSDVGIVMVTARGHIQDKVQGYASGADIYLPKPVDPDELLAVVDRFSHKVMQDKVVSGDAVFSYSKLLLEKDAQHVHLTQSEGNLLNAFFDGALANSRALAGYGGDGGQRRDNQRCQHGGADRDLAEKVDIHRRHHLVHPINPEIRLSSVSCPYFQINLKFGGSIFYVPLSISLACVGIRGYCKSVLGYAWPCFLTRFTKNLWS
jgi:CheY-like chemotaxis protein